MTTLGPIQVTRKDQQVCFTLGKPDVTVSDLPANYESFLSEQLAAQFGADALGSAVLDLQNAPAISSRQLGVMLALHKARTRQERLPLLGVSPGVRDLLETTRTSRFFSMP